MASDSLSVTSTAELTVDEDISPLTRTLRILGWTILFILCLVAFTLKKLPEERIKNYVQGTITSLLSEKGISFEAERGYLSFGWGISYIMKGIKLTVPNVETPAKIDEISVTPSILPLLIGQKGAVVWIYSGGGKMMINASMKKNSLSLAVDSSALDLGKTGVLPVFAGIKGAALLNGTAKLTGDPMAMNTFTGDVDLKLEKISMDPQQIQGFSLPKMNVSEAVIQLSIDKQSRVTFKNVHVGKPGNTADDIQATITGDAILGRNFDASILNARAKFTLSQNILTSFVLIDALLAQGKLPGGGYGYSLTGPLGNLGSAPLAEGNR